MLSSACSIFIILRILRGDAPTDTRAPYPAQYRSNFRLVNATGVPVFRTGYCTRRREQHEYKADFINQRFPSSNRTKPPPFHV